MRSENRIIKKYKETKMRQGNHLRHSLVAGSMELVSVGGRWPPPSTGVLEVGLLGRWPTPSNL